MPNVYTIGYGDRKFDDFVELLKRFGIELIIDIRRFPTSKWPEFVKENLQRALSAKGISYVHIRELGGYRGGYRAYTRTQEFKQALRELMELTREKPSAIMCVESSPSACHRRFIASELKRRRWKIMHIVGNGKQQTL